MKEYLEFEKKMMSNPKMFFPMFESGFDWRSKIIWQEFLDWQNGGGRIESINFREIDKEIFTWSFGNEHFVQKIDESAPFSIEQYKNGLLAVFSFMKDRPQYYKFRKLEGMFNPLKLLLYQFL